MATTDKAPDEDPVREDFVEERPVWEEDLASAFSPEWDPNFEPEKEEEAGEAPPPKEPPIENMGVRSVARSADGLTVLNTLEVLPPFDFSV
jgi:hypothetical protein